MTKHEFHHALRVLMCIDRHELIEAGVFISSDELSMDGWKRFKADPFRFFIRISDTQADALWALIEARVEPRAEPLTHSPPSA